MSFWAIERLDRELWTMAAAMAGLLAALLLIPMPLSLLPEPIGPAAALFGRGARATLLLTCTSGSIGLLVGTLAALAGFHRLAQYGGW